MLRIKLEKNDLEIIITILATYCSFFFETLLPGAIILLMFWKESKKHVLLLLFILLGACLIALTDVKSGIRFILYSSLIIIIGERFKNYPERFFTFFNYFSFLFVFVLLVFGETNYGSWLSSLLSSGRLWVSLGGFEINPNVLASVCAISCVYLFNKKKWILSILMFLVIICTQSRGAILFLLITYLFTLNLSSKKIAGAVLTLALFLVFIINSPLYDRFKNEGGSLRGYIYKETLSLIDKNFPFAVPESSLEVFKATIGPIDNLYLMSTVQFGSVGIIFILLAVLYSLRRFSNSIFFALVMGFYVYGLVESSFIHNLIYLSAFSVSLFAISNPDRKKEESNNYINKKTKTTYEEENIELKESKKQSKIEQ